MGTNVIFFYLANKHNKYRVGSLWLTFSRAGVVNNFQLLLILMCNNKYHLFFQNVIWHKI